MQPKFPAFDHTNPVTLMNELGRMLPPAHRAALDLVLANAPEAYLVGGIVRDLLLGRTNVDLDFVCPVAASTVVQRLLPPFEQHFGVGRVKWLEHSKFGTVRVDIADTDLHLDFATARQEVYDQPAALPTVSFPATLEEDLRRRDFTINTLALSPRSGFYDPYDGLTDLRDGWIRVLHEASFRDDPTRLVRGVRFAARFGYKFEPETARLFQEALGAGYVRLLSAERKRNELRLILKEVRPQKGLALLQSTGLLAALHPLLTWNELLEQDFARLQAQFDYNVQPYEYLAVLVHRLGASGARQVVRELRFAGLEAEEPMELARLWEQVLPQLAGDLKNSQLYRLLSSYRPEALRIFEALLPEDYQREGVRRYREQIAGRGPVLNGDDLLGMGVPPGPTLGRLLAQLKAAALDGELTSREAEEAFVRRYLAGKG